MEAGYFLEDDARLETDVGDREFCLQANRDELAQNFPGPTRSSYSLASTTDRKRPKGKQQAYGWSSPEQRIEFRPLVRSFGTYGWVVPQKRLATVRDHYRATLLLDLDEVVRANHTAGYNKGSLAPDKNLYSLAEREGLRFMIRTRS